MEEKIRGEFLKMERIGNKYEISFVNERGIPRTFQMGTENMDGAAESAKWALKNIRMELASASNLGNSVQLKEYQKQEDYHLVMMLFPKMFIAHCRGEDINIFFDPPHLGQKLQSEEDWISVAKQKGWLSENFVPFRVFTEVFKREDGTWATKWCSWFPDSRNELQRMNELQTGSIKDPLIIGDSDNELEINLRLDAIEEKLYRAKIKTLPLVELRRQYELWKKLQERSPMMTPDNLIQLVCAPEVILKDEILARLAESSSSDSEGDGIKETIKDKCGEECKRLGLVRGKTLTKEKKYEIAKAINLERLGSITKFRSGNSAYHRISKMLSELGYCKKNPSKYRK